MTDSRPKLCPLGPLRALLTGLQPFVQLTSSLFALVVPLDEGPCQSSGSPVGWWGSLPMPMNPQDVLCPPPFTVIGHVLWQHLGQPFGVCHTLTFVLLQYALLHVPLPGTTG